MAKVIVGMTTSLDGFVNDRNGSVERLYPDLEALRKTDFLKEVIAYTGAVVMGRRAYDMGNGDFTGYEFQVPIFVVTHRPPKEPTKGQNANLTLTFVTDGTEAAVQKAKKAAGTRDVTVVGGPDTAQQIIRAGLADELEIGIVPVLFGDGLRFLENLGDLALQLETVKVMKSPGRTDIRYRIVKQPTASLNTESRNIRR
jgi:dihydrofolate reductase